MKILLFVLFTIFLIGIASADIDLEIGYDNPDLPRAEIIDVSSVSCVDGVDTSAHVNCSTNEVFLGNGSCMAITQFPAGSETDPIWTGNYSIFTGLIQNASYLSTFNLTYHLYAFNVSLNYSKIVYDTWNALWSTGGNPISKFFRKYRMDKTRAYL